MGAIYSLHTDDGDVPLIWPSATYQHLQRSEKNYFIPNNNNSPGTSRGGGYYSNPGVGKPGG